MGSCIFKRAATALIAALVVVAAATFVSAAAAAVPSNSVAPTISGSARQGQTLTASNGTWSSSPTSFSYQWQHCNIDGTGCADISGATKQTYTLLVGDVDHRVVVQVTATNADGHATASSDPTEVVSAATGPTNSTKPTITGSATVGEELTAHNGSWSGASSFTHQWLRCTPGATFDCVSVVGATGTTYGVRSADVGKQLRVVVRASSATGSHGWATSDPTAKVAGTTPVTTTTTTTTTTVVNGHKAPTLVFISLHRSGTRVFIRFKVCASRPGHITIIERDNKAGALSFTRQYRVTIAACGSFSRSFVPAARFRTHGRYVVTLRAEDTSGFLSLLRSRSLFF
jgi:hypothetical protein